MNSNVERKIIYEENDVSYTFTLFENVLHIEAVWQTDYAMWTTTIECTALSNEKIADESKIDTSYIVTNYTPTDKFNIINDYVNKMLNPKEYVVCFKKVKNADTALVIEIITKYQYSEKEDVSMILIDPKPIGFNDKILKNVDIHKNSTNIRFSQLKDEINTRLVVLEDGHKALRTDVSYMSDDYIIKEELDEALAQKHKELDDIFAKVTTVDDIIVKFSEKMKTELVGMEKNLTEKMTQMQSTFDTKYAEMENKMKSMQSAFDIKYAELEKTNADKITTTLTALQGQMTKLQTDLETCMSKLPQ
uniref:Uncharacterized protein n=1 Tax=viral metagenome TaxID=1070528 RepID=A0A6C0CC35_9ZZZZ